MSKILVLGRTMDMGGTEVAMAALLQKLVEKKEDVTLLLVEKRGVLLERIPKEVEVRQMIWDKKPHPALERIVGKRETSMPCAFRSSRILSASAKFLAFFASYRFKTSASISGSPSPVI